MNTPRRLCGALENYFGGHDQEIMREILGILELHFSGSGASPWIFSQDAQPDVGVEVICLDVSTLDGSTEVNTATRSEGKDWTDFEAPFWWMHVPPLPEGGLLRVQESPETRVDAGNEGGHQALPEGGDQTAQESPENRMDTGGGGGDQSDTPFAWWMVLIGALADEHAAAAGAVAALRAQCAPHEDIQAAVNVANSARAELLQHVRIGCAEHNNKES